MDNQQEALWDGTLTLKVTSVDCATTNSQKGHIITNQCMGEARSQTTGRDWYWYWCGGPGRFHPTSRPRIGYGFPRP